MKKTKQAQAPFPDPPAHLSERSAALWRQLGPKEARSAGRQVVLQQALEALDRCDAARAAIATEGMTSKTESTGATHAHPLTKLERDAQKQFLACWRALGLERFRSIVSELMG